MKRSAMGPSGSLRCVYTRCEMVADNVSQANAMGWRVWSNGFRLKALCSSHAEKPVTRGAPR